MPRSRRKPKEAISETRPAPAANCEPSALAAGRSMMSAGQSAHPADRDDYGHERTPGQAREKIKTMGMPASSSLGVTSASRTHRASDVGEAIEDGNQPVDTPESTKKKQVVDPREKCSIDFLLSSTPQSLTKMGSRDTRASARQRARRQAENEDEGDAEHMERKGNTEQANDLPVIICKEKDNRAHPGPAGPQPQQHLKPTSEPVPEASTHFEPASEPPQGVPTHAECEKTHAGQETTHAEQQTPHAGPG